MIYPAMNTLWFWFDKATRRALHGTPADCERKFEILVAKGGWQGLEIFLTPARLHPHQGFSRNFVRAFRELDYRSVHIGDADPDFLDGRQAARDLQRLHAVLQELETPRIILHAHHLEKNRAQRVAILRDCLPGTTILIENNGFDAGWGYRPEDLLELFRSCPEFGLCLDITHVADFQELCLATFLAHPSLAGRIQELHVSYSTHLLEQDPYAARGYMGYSPFHALFSVIDEEPPREAVELAQRVPVILEGIVPKEDTDCIFLTREKALLADQGEMQ